LSQWASGSICPMLDTFDSLAKRRELRQMAVEASAF
jgi:hypothetical protein